MQLKKIAAILIGSFAIAGSASAVTFDGSSGAATVTDYSSGSLLSFDLDFNSIGNVVLNFTVDSADIGSGLSFNALNRLLNGISSPSASFWINGASFASIGSLATDGFQAISAQGGNANYRWMTFDPALTSEFYIGAPLGNGSDWGINLAGLSAGDTFSITVAVPEPEQYAMLLAGLGLLGVAAKRRKQG